MKKQHLCACVALVLMAIPAAAQITIDEIAPENTVLVAGVDDISEVIARLKRAGLWELWESEEIQALIGDYAEEWAAGYAEMYRKLEIEMDTFAMPTGGAGMAMFSVPAEDEFDPPSLGSLAFVDFGENADAFGELVDAALQRMADDGDAIIDEIDVLGRTVQIIETFEDEEEEFEDEFEMDDFGLGLPGMPDPEIFVAMMRRSFYVREGDVFLLASDLEPLRDALATMDEEDEPRLGSREDFQDARTQLGDADGYALLLTRNFGEVMGIMDDTGMMQMLIAPSISALVGTVGAIGTSVRFDGEQAMVEQRYTLFLPEGKDGLFALIDHPRPRADLPSFVGPDAIGYSSFAFDFDGVLEFVQNVIDSNMMLQMQFGQNMEQVEQYVRGICDPLGDTIHMVTTLKKPLAADSLSSLYVIDCPNPEAFETMIAELGPAMGFEPRDFLGGRIYTMEALMLPIGGFEDGMSLGLGGGYLFLGQTPAVEQGLRTAGVDDLASLSDDPDYQRGMGSLSGDALVAWGYTAYLESMKASAAIERLQMEETIQQMEEFDPEFAAEMKADMEENQGALDSFDYSFLERYFGPSVWQIKSTDEGFVVSSYMLSAGE